MQNLVLASLAAALAPSLAPSTLETPARLVRLFDRDTETLISYLAANGDRMHSVTYKLAQAIVASRRQRVRGDHIAAERNELIALELVGV